MRRSIDLKGRVRVILLEMEGITYRLARTKFHIVSNLPWSQGTYDHEAVNYPLKMLQSKLTRNVMLQFGELFIISLWKKIQLTQSVYTQEI